MKSLRSPEKKLYFKILLHVFIMCVIGMAITMSIEIMGIKEAGYRDQRDSIINSYETKIKTKDSVNNTLIIKQHSLQLQVDSLENVKGIINAEYDQEIKSIYDASAIDHALWMDTTIAKLNHFKR